MLKLSFTTTETEEEILREAKQFFTNEGLVETKRAIHQVQFEGGGGYVKMDVAGHGPVEVILETREWDYQVKQFAQQHGKHAPQKRIIT